MASEIPALRYRWCTIGAQIFPQAGIFRLIGEAVAYRVLNLMLAICGAISRCIMCRFGGESGGVRSRRAGLPGGRVMLVPAPGRHFGGGAYCLG